MTNAYSLPGLLCVLLLVICSAAYVRRIPTLRRLLMSEKSGLPGTLYKCAVVGTRLHWQVSAASALLGVYLLLLHR